jgi:hypothetical protein
MSNSKYTWRLLHKSPDGHSFWLDENSQRISIKDLSGDTPETTDDGVLFLDGAWVLDDKYVSIPVVSPDWKASRCAETRKNGIECAIALGQTLRVDSDSAPSLPLSLVSLLLGKAKAIHFEF